MMPGTPPLTVSDTGRPALRLGIALSCAVDVSFLAPILQAIAQSNFLDPVLIIHVETDIQERAPGGPGRNPIEQIHGWWDTRRNRKHLEQQRLSMAHSIKPLPTLTISAGEASSGAHRDAIRGYELDVIIASGPSDSAFLGSCAQRGVWSLDMSGANGTTGRAYLPETSGNGGSVSGIELIAHRDADRCALVLGHSITKNVQSLSLIEARQVKGKAAAELICWKLWQLHESGWSAAAGDQIQLVSPPAEQGDDGESGSAGGLSFLGNRLINRISNLARPSGIREWQIGVRRMNGAAPWEGSADDLQWIQAPSGRYLADPFLFERDGQMWLFAEDFVHADDKGRLVCAPLAPDGQVGAWETVLDLPYHLSFPYVFAHDREIYLIPESSAGGSVDLYRAEEFPYRWTKLRTLWEGPALDTVPYLAGDGSWYFFTSVQSHKLMPPALLLFSAPDLLSPWRTHPASPLSLDVRYARNAGRIIETSDESGGVRLIRPSQDGSGKYGCRMHFHEIQMLSPDRYAERLVATRLPPVGRDGIHHYDQAGKWEVFDASFLARPG